MEIILKPIGTVHSPFQKKEDIKKFRNINPEGYKAVREELEIFEEFVQGLQDLDGLSHIILIFAFHESVEKKLYTYPGYQTLHAQRPNNGSPIRLAGAMDHEKTLEVRAQDILISKELEKRCCSLVL